MLPSPFPAMSPKILFPPPAFESRILVVSKNVASFLVSLDPIRKNPISIVPAAFAISTPNLKDLEIVPILPSPASFSTKGVIIRSF